ncbi:MAG: acetylornithine deacetylase [Myxococcota bacterium]
MTEPLDSVLGHLKTLVACRTPNPPREIDASHEIVSALRAPLEQVGFDVRVADHGDGSVSVMAARGRPSILMNCHVDTVPAAPSWERDPFELLVTHDRAIGLGACDIKGAAACMLAAAERTQGPVALLFTSDEEAGKGRCVRSFAADPEALEPFDVVFVAEPTSARAVLEHRGIWTCRGTFTGTAGHASDPRALEDSAVHEAMRWMHGAMSVAHDKREHEQYRGLPGIAFNVGRVEGGTKPNMIADEAMVWWGMRPLPTHDPEALHEVMVAPADASRVVWEPGFHGPTLPASIGGEPGAARAGAARAKAEALGLSVGEPVNFWTEAALFSAAGADAVVFGPGDIAQAHTAGEWVALDDLEQVLEVYMRLMTA